jgi:hypothetical protein
MPRNILLTFRLSCLLRDKIKYTVKAVGSNLSVLRYGVGPFQSYCVLQMNFEKQGNKHSDVQTITSPSMSRWHMGWGFFPRLPTEPCALGLTQPLKMSTRKTPGRKAGRCVRLTTYHLLVPNVKKIRGLNLPDLPWACSGLSQDSF